MICLFVGGDADSWRVDVTNIRWPVRIPAMRKPCVAGQRACGENGKKEFIGASLYNPIKFVTDEGAEFTIFGHSSMNQTDVFRQLLSSYKKG